MIFFLNVFYRYIFIHNDDITYYVPKQVARYTNILCKILKSLNAIQILLKIKECLL